MSYILFATSGGGLATPVSVPNGGTSADNAKDAVVNLTSPAFGASASSVDWGILPVPAVAAPDLGAIEISLTELLNTLQTLSIIQVV